VLSWGRISAGCNIKIRETRVRPSIDLQHIYSKFRLDDQKFVSAFGTVRSARPTSYYLVISDPVGAKQSRSDVNQRDALGTPGTDIHCISVQKCRVVARPSGEMVTRQSAPF